MSRLCVRQKTVLETRQTQRQQSHSSAAAAEAPGLNRLTPRLLLRHIREGLGRHQGDSAQMIPRGRGPAGSLGFAGRSGDGCVQTAQTNPRLATEKRQGPLWGEALGFRFRALAAEETAAEAHTSRLQGGDAAGAPPSAWPWQPRPSPPRACRPCAAGGLSSGYSTLSSCLLSPSPLMRRSARRHSKEGLTTEALGSRVYTKTPLQEPQGFSLLLPLETSGSGGTNTSTGAA